MAESLDSAVKARLRAVVSRQAVTEAELRRVAEDGHACALIVSGLLARCEQRLSQLDSDPASSLSEIATTLRNLNELRPDLEELEELLEQLERRAREYRADWLSAS
jgi:chromosome segregation ATPase